MLLGAEFHAARCRASTESLGCNQAVKQLVISPWPVSTYNESIRACLLTHLPLDVARLVHSYATFVRGQYVNSFTISVDDNAVGITLAAFGDKVYSLQIFDDGKCCGCTLSVVDKNGQELRRVDMDLPSFGDNASWWGLQDPGIYMYHLPSIKPFNWWLNVSEKYMLVWAALPHSHSRFWFKVLDRREFRVVKPWFRHEFIDGTRPIHAQVVDDTLVLLTTTHMHQIPLVGEERPSKRNLWFLSTLQHALFVSSKYYTAVNAHLDVEHQDVLFTVMHEVDATISEKTFFRVSACAAKCWGDQLVVLRGEPSAVKLTSKSSTAFMQILQPPAETDDDSEWKPFSFSFTEVDGVVSLLVFSRYLVRSRGVRVSVFQ